MRETIETSALLRLPLSVSREEKEQIVEEIICQLVSSLAGTPACPTRLRIEAWLACLPCAVRVGRQSCHWLAKCSHQLAQFAVLEACAAVRAG